MPDRLSIYHALPYPLKVLAASLRGLQLRWWRYGPDTERLVAEALERETWSSDQWRAWQEERLAFILHRAATRVPYYREQWAARRKQGDAASWELLENWPVLSKESLRLNPRAFIADDCSTRTMFQDHTSGTSGKSLHLWLSRKSVRAWYALYEARARGWHGVSRREPWGILGGQLVVPAAQTRPPFWVWNAGLNQLYLSSYHLSPAFIPHHLEAILRHRIVYLLGYTSALYELALGALNSKRNDIHLRVVITNAEPLHAYQREVISQAFHCPVRETYGMAEIVCAASECEHGSMHLWPEVGFYEILKDDEDNPVSPGEPGRLIATGLINADMPLIRYEVGDRISMPVEDSVCPCGRNLPLLGSIEGRKDDVLITRDGRRIGRMDPVFKIGLHVVEAQVIQDSMDHLTVRVVPGAGYSAEDQRHIAAQIKLRLGEIAIDFEELPAIPRDKNGKFRAVISNLHDTRRSAPFFDDQYKTH